MKFLKDFQYDAVDHMHNGCILNGGTGSGKSITGLYYYHNVICRGHIEPPYKQMKDPLNLYIITTARKRDTLEWNGELARYMLSTESENPKVIVDSWNNIGKYAKVEGAFFIFDEDRVIGSGAWVKAFLKIAKVNKWILLSATPGDTWADYIPVFIANGFYERKSDFVREHIVYSRWSRWPKIERYLNTGKLIRLRNRVLVNMDFERHTVPHHETVWTDYDRMAYKRVRKDRWDYIRDEPILTASTLCQCLRRIVNSDPSRLAAVEKLMEEKDKAIIFYNYDYELDLLKDRFTDSQYEVAEWNGHKHEEISGGGKWVYLVQYNAGCEGWNCITTDTIIFYSENYSYRIMTQAAGRIDRLNTPFVDLWYYHLKSHADIDLAIAKALEKKKNFNQRKFFDSY